MQNVTIGRYDSDEGSPEIYWGQRDPNGGVIGDGIPLT